MMNNRENNKFNKMKLKMKLIELNSLKTENIYLLLSIIIFPNCIEYFPKWLYADSILYRNNSVWRTIFKIVHINIHSHHCTTICTNPNNKIPTQKAIRCTHTNTKTATQPTIWTKIEYHHRVRHCCIVPFILQNDCWISHRKFI